MTEGKAFSGFVYFQKERHENDEKSAKCLKIKLGESGNWEMLDLDVLSYRTYFDKE